MHDSSTLAVPTDVFEGLGCSYFLAMLLVQGTHQECVYPARIPVP